MPCELLVRANDTGKYAKGTILTVKPVVYPPGGTDSRGNPLPTDPIYWSWGSAEWLPNYIHVEISDAEVSEIEDYVNNRLKTLINWELQNSNASGRRYRLFVHPYIINNFGEGAGIKQEIRDLLVNDYGATIQSYSAADASAVVDIPNTDWQALRDDLVDKFEGLVGDHAIKRYIVDSASVDAVVAAGGKVTRTKAQVQAVITDRLA